jgi:hypothetical protein
VVVYDLDAFGARARPAKADAVLIVHSDAVLAGAVTLEGLKSITRRYPKIFKRSRDFQLTKLASGDRLDADEPNDSSAAGERLSVGILE